MRYEIEHKLGVSFPEAVREHHCELRLAPPDTTTQRVHSVRLATEPAAQIGTYVDCFGNPVHHFSVIAPHDAVEVLLHAEVETLLANPFDYTIVVPGQERDWIGRALSATPGLWDYVLHRSDLVPAPERLARHDLQWPAYDPKQPLRDAVSAAATWAAEILELDPKATPHASLEAALEAGTGSCADLTHLLIAAVRAWGVPARYIRGDVDPERDDEPDASEPVTPGPRAWVEVLIPGAGWRGFDPLEQLVANDTYIVVAVGRDASEVAPCRSSFKGSAEPETHALHRRVKRSHDQ